MQQTVVQYLPHQPPMVLIDELLEAGEDYAIAKVTIRPELMFVEEQGLPTWATIELMAQTVSLYAGVQGAANGIQPRIGFLLGTRKMILPCAFFPVGSELIVKATQNYLHDQLGVFICELHYLQHCIQATLSVYVPDQTEL